MTLRRTTPMQRGGRIKRGTTPLPKVNARQQAKKRAAYKSYLSSAAWKAIRKAALERAGGRCERECTVRENWITWVHRCEETEKLTVHHLTYARFGGDELPDDLLVLCQSCHREIEAMKGKRGAS